jgi:hypothetical protein
VESGRWRHERREFIGRPSADHRNSTKATLTPVSEQHPYELLLAMEGIEHRRTKIATPRTNGFVERMNRTLLDG